MSEAVTAKGQSKPCPYGMVNVGEPFMGSRREGTRPSPTSLGRAGVSPAGMMWSERPRAQQAAPLRQRYIAEAA